MITQFPVLHILGSLDPGKIASIMANHVRKSIQEPVEIAVVKRRSRGHTKPCAPVIDINGPGRLRVANLMALFGMGHSTLYSRIRSGKFPPRDGLDGAIPYWNTATIRPLLEE